MLYIYIYTAYEKFSSGQGDSKVYNSFFLICGVCISTSYDQLSVWAHGRVPKYADESVDMDWLCEICFCGLPLWESQRFLQPKFENLEIDPGYVKGNKAKWRRFDDVVLRRGEYRYGRPQCQQITIWDGAFCHSVFILRLDVCFFTIWFSLWISSMYIHAFLLSGMTINEFGFLWWHEAPKWLCLLRSPLRSRSPSLLFVSQGLCFC